MKAHRLPHIRVFRDFEEFSFQFPMRRPDGLDQQRQVICQRYLGIVTPEEAYYNGEMTWFQNRPCLNEDVWGLRELRRRIRDGRRHRRVAALYGFNRTEDGFWIVPYLDVDGAWCAEEVYPLSPHYDVHEWDFLTSPMFLI